MNAKRSSNQFDCRVCSQSFDSATGLKVHYSAYPSTHMDDGEYPQHLLDMLPEGSKDNYTELTCEMCGETYDRHKSIAEQSRFCSLDCQGEWTSENLSGEDHPLWKGGRLPRSAYGGGLHRLRDAVKERDGYTCQACGRNEGEVRQLDTHHIIPIRQFDSYHDAHTLGNLVTFCTKCHSRWEGIPLRPSLIGDDPNTSREST